PGLEQTVAEARAEQNERLQEFVPQPTQAPVTEVKAAIPAAAMKTEAQPIFAAADPTAAYTPDGRRFLLFTTKTCPNCLIVKTWMDGQGIKYETILAEENRELSRKYGIMLAPSAVIVAADGSYEKYVGVSEIKNFVEGVYAKNA
ncbi:MAG: hypothetical protein MJ150_05000, partial [Clostridia bacterium]|nr:hypothetical protein [Clostridia bacterium]